MQKNGGVFIADDVRDLFSQSPEIVINLTGEPKVSEFIKQTAPYPVEIIEGTSAKFLWDLVRRQQIAKNDMSVLYQSGIRITKARNLKEVLNEALKSAMELIETPAGSIALIDGDEMVMAVHRGLNREFFKEKRWKPRKDGLTYRILRHKEPLEFQDTEKNPIFEGTRILKEGIRSLLASPLPLDGGIVGFSEVLLDRTFGDINEKQQRHVTNILTSGRHLLHLVNNILDLAKIEAGRIELSHETFSLKAVIDEVLIVVKHLADRKRIELKTDISHEVANFIEDKVKFKQVLYNLLSNAIKFTPKSGKVGIRTEKLINSGLLPWAIKGQEFLKLSVWDTGIGIRTEDKERVFDEFEQLDPSKSTKGIGLGLSLAKKLVELHGGYIDVESNYGKGSAFNVYIPVIISEKYEEERPALPEAVTLVTDEVENAPLVLVVEDDIPTSELLFIHLPRRDTGLCTHITAWRQ